MTTHVHLSVHPILTHLTSGDPDSERVTPHFEIIQLNQT